MGTIAAPNMDVSVLDEMATRMRAAGIWDNRLGDSLQFLLRRIELLEEFSKFEQFEVRTIRRPLDSWKSCRDVLLAITQSRRSTLSEWPAPLTACLNLAVNLALWERDGVPQPTDIRGMSHGGIAVEWKDKSVIFDGNGIVGEVPEATA